MNPLISATLVFDGSEEELDASDFVETSGGGGHTCENFFDDYVLEDPESLAERRARLISAGLG
jgi:hypothetical protein